MEQSLWQYLQGMARAEGWPLVAGAGVLLGWGLWRQQRWLLPVVAILLLLAVLLRWLWHRLRPDTLVDEASYQYPEEVLLPEETEDLAAYFALGEELAAVVAAEAQEQESVEETLPSPEAGGVTRQGGVGWLSLVLLAALTLLYCWALEWLGFLPATYGYLCLLLWLLGESRGVVVMLVPAVLTAAAALVLPLVGVGL